MQTKGQFFSVTHAPVAATQATASQASGGAGNFNHCTGMIVSFSAGATASAAPATVNLRDGATGAGTVLASFDIDCAVVQTASQVVLSGLDIPGSAATAMTLEFAAAGAATTLEKVTLLGYMSNSPNAAWMAL